MIAESLWWLVLYVQLFTCLTFNSDTKLKVNITKAGYDHDDDRRHATFDGLDLSLPYGFGHHGPNHHYHFVRDCQNIKYSNVTHTLSKIHFDLDVKLPIINARTIITTNEDKSFNKQTSSVGHYYVINNPLKTVSVMEPLHEGTCARTPSFRATVRDTASSRQCLLAVNAGFFNTDTGACLGNIVSDGRLAQDNGGIQNAHFGILKNGSLFFGFLSESDLIEANFQQLVGGVIWLIRDGEVYINESQQLECSDTLMSGSLEYFINVQSARSAVGHDRDGRLVIVQIDGQTLKRGVNLWELAALLLDLGVVNAINLDGGGSVTTIMNGTLVNYPSSLCTDSSFLCEREVSTILCVHEPECSPLDCNRNGRCIMGRCECDRQWAGDTCDRLVCKDNCNDHGRCTSDGCICDLGWVGETCDTSSSQGWYGLKCSQKCVCHQSNWCSHIDGSCICLLGYTGRLCDRECAHGLYGVNCSKPCYCSTGCSCDPITRSCQMSLNGTALLQVCYLPTDSQTLAPIEAESISLVNNLNMTTNVTYDNIVVDSKFILFNLIIIAIVLCLIVLLGVVGFIRRHRLISYITQQCHQTPSSRHCEFSALNTTDSTIVADDDNDNDDDDDDDETIKVETEVNLDDGFTAVELHGMETRAAARRRLDETPV